MDAPYKNEPQTSAALFDPILDRACKNGPHSVPAQRARTGTSQGSLARKHFPARVNSLTLDPDLFNFATFTNKKWFAT